MLSDFFRINMPYGIQKNNKGEWMAFNREYKPIGFYTFKVIAHDNYPIFVNYPAINEQLLINLAHSDGESIIHEPDGSISKIFLYNDRTNPMNNPLFWPDYFDKIKILSALESKPIPGQ